MASRKALFRIRVRDPSRNSAHLRTLDDCLQVRPEVRRQWAEAIEKKFRCHTDPDHHHGIRDWDLVLDPDGSVENIADSPYLSPPSVSVRTTEIE